MAMMPYSGADPWREGSWDNWQARDERRILTAAMRWGTSEAKDTRDFGKLYPRPVGMGSRPDGRVRPRTTAG